MALAYAVAPYTWFERLILRHARELVDPSTPRGCQPVWS